MSNHPSNNTATEEIDLGYLINKLGVLFRKSVKKLFEVIAFLIKFKFIVIAILLIGFGYGYYNDKTALKSYQNEVLVIPNVESVDYMYDMVKAVNAKVQLNDSTFLKEVIGEKYKYLRKVEVEAIVDIYNFVSESRENIDVFRILFMNQDPSDYMEDLTNSKYYKYHRLNFTVVGKDNSEEVVERILQYFNANTHYGDYLNIGKANTELQIRENIQMIAQIDSVLKASANLNTGLAAGAVSIHENAELYRLIEKKQELLNHNLVLQMRKYDESSIIKTVNANYNITNKTGLVISKKIKTPLLWLFVFCFVFFLKYMYFKMKEIAEES